MRVPKEEWPDGWVPMPLGDLCEIQIGKTPRRSQLEYWGGPYTWVTISDMTGRVVSDSKEGITDKAIEDGQARLVKDGTLLMSFKLTIGKLAFAGQDLYTNEAIAALILRDEFKGLVRDDFLYWALQAVPIAEEADLAVKGFTLNKGKMARVEVPVPYPDEPDRSLEIQQRIVTRIEALLAELRAARELHEKVVEDTGRLMHAVLEEVFGDIRQGFEVGNIPSDEIADIGDICDLRRGKFSHRPRNDPQFFGGPYPWVQIQNVPKEYGKYITTHMNTLNEAGLAISRMFPKGTIVISIAATIGAVGILAFDACFPDSLVGITPKPEEGEQMDTGFLYWQLSHVKSHLESVAPYAAQKNINLGILGQLQIWKPQEGIQRRINAYLNSVQDAVTDMHKTNKQDQDLLSDLEQSILAQAFRGEL